MLSFLPPEIVAAGTTILLRSFKLYHCRKLAAVQFDCHSEQAFFAR
jgi:hypothetical protein